MEVLSFLTTVFTLFFFGGTSVIQPPINEGDLDNQAFPPGQTLPIIEAEPVGLKDLPLNSVPGNTEIFAQCLAKKGAVMYGAFWCPHCQQQAKLFGDAFKFITYQECDAKGPNGNPQICKNQGITSYPTWKFPNHPDLVGEQTFAALAEAANCPIN